MRRDLAPLSILFSLVHVRPGSLFCVPCLRNTFCNAASLSSQVLSSLTRLLVCCTLASTCGLRATVYLQVLCEERLKASEKNLKRTSRTSATNSDSTFLANFDAVLLHCCVGCRVARLCIACLLLDLKCYVSYHVLQHVDVSI